MTHPDFRALCARALKAEELILPGGGDFWRDHEEEAQALGRLMSDIRAALSVPQQGAPSDRIRQIADDVKYSASSWDSDVRILGNVTAEDVADLCDAVLARHGAQAAPVAEVTGDWFYDFAQWLAKEMPAGTVIGDPQWWAPRIARAVTSRFLASPEEKAVPVAEHRDLWCEDYGACLWWVFPIAEPPYSGTPLDCDWPGYHTHFTRITCPELPLPEAQP